MVGLRIPVRTFARVNHNVYLTFVKAHETGTGLAEIDKRSTLESAGWCQEHQKEMRLLVPVCEELQHCVSSQLLQDLHEDPDWSSKTLLTNGKYRDMKTAIRRIIGVTTTQFVLIVAHSNTTSLPTPVSGPARLPLRATS